MNSNNLYAHEHAARGPNVPDNPQMEEDKRQFRAAIAQAQGPRRTKLMRMYYDRYQEYPML